jgi:hypothetical protein
MPLFWTAVWAVVIFGSIFWYTAMLFTVGFKAGREIGELAGRLEAQTPADTASRRAQNARDS